MGTVTELEKESVQCITENDNQYVLIYQQGAFYLLDNLCPHKAAALCDGDVSGHEITCPWHRARFDIKTGRGLSPLAGSGVKSWSLKIVQDSLIAELP